MQKACCIILFLHKHLSENRNTFVDEGDLPKEAAAVVVKSSDEIDYIVGQAPLLRDISGLENMEAAV